MRTQLVLLHRKAYLDSLHLVQPLWLPSKVIVHRLQLFHPVFSSLGMAIAFLVFQHTLKIRFIITTIRSLNASSGPPNSQSILLSSSPYINLSFLLSYRLLSMINKTLVLILHHSLTTSIISDIYTRGSLINDKVYSLNIE